MAIALDATSTYSDTTDTASSFSWSHTCSGNDRLLVVCFLVRNYTAGSDPYSSLKYAGVEVPWTGVHYQPWGSGNGWLYYFNFTGHTSGTNTIQATFTENVSFQAVAASYTGVIDEQAQTPQLTATTSSSPITVLGTTGSDQSWLIGCMASTNSGTKTAYTDTNTRVSAADTEALKLADSFVELGGANPDNTFELGYTFSGTQDCGMIGLFRRPTASATSIMFF